MDRATIINKLQKYFVTHRHVIKAWLFGSWAKGLQHKGSNIDIAARYSNDREEPLVLYIEEKDSILKELRKLLGYEKIQYELENDTERVSKWVNDEGGSILILDKTLIKPDS